MELPILKKSFVSLFYTSQKLQILQLNPQKNQVVKFQTLDLPEGLIVKHKINDKKTASNILKDAWKRLGLKEKAVGIVIPEFSTFTKSMVLPKLDSSELDEAVRWQFQDFWPQSDGQMVMDWKIVQKLKNNCQILSVAMPEDLLMSFVDVAGEAGLFPLVVETPSISLTRISDGDPSAKMVIYANFGEVILSIAKGEEILGSSVFKAATPNHILWTANQMIRHYKNIEIKRIQIGGLELTQQLVEDLQKTLNKPVNWVQPKIQGFSPKDIQEYLIPISLQYKNPSEPSDETTVNLLPPKWIKHYQDKKTKVQVWSFLLLASFIIWGCFLVTIGVYLNLLRQIRSFEEVPIQAVALPQEVSSQISETNKLSSKVAKITSVSKLPQEVIKAIVELKPAGVTLTNYQIDLDSSKIYIKGRANSRQNLVDFQKALQESDNFSEVKFPISALEKEEDLQFEATLTYGQLEKKGVIKIPVK